MSMEYIDSSYCPFCEWYNALKSRDKYYEDGRDGRSCVTEFKYGAAWYTKHTTMACFLAARLMIHNPSAIAQPVGKS